MARARRGGSSPPDSTDRHHGPDVAPMSLEVFECAGANHQEEGTHRVDGYVVSDRQGGIGFGPSLKLCKRCAVKLAVKILDLESI